MALSPLSPMTDCHDNSLMTAKQAALSATPLRGEPGPAVRLQARFHAACVSANVGGYVPGADYLLRLDHRTVSGHPAKVCLWEVGLDRCATIPALPSSESWNSYRAVVTPDRGTLGLKLFLYAFGDGAPVPTVTEYRRVGVGTAPSLAAAAVQIVPDTNSLPAWHASESGVAPS